MGPTQRDEMVGRFAQLFPGLTLEFFHLLQKEFEQHEVEIVEGVIHRLRAESETFNFRRLRELLQYESGRKNDVPRVIERRMKVKSERAAADASFHRAADAVDDLSDEEFANLLQ